MAKKKHDADMVEDFFGHFMCEYCAHYHGVNTCEAYPEQIPIEIISGRVVHYDPYKGDHGIQFKAKEK